MEHLLLTPDRLLCEPPVVSVPANMQNLAQESLDIEWKTANEFYFKSMGSVQLLWQIALKSKKDFSSAQVNSACDSI